MSKPLEVTTTHLTRRSVLASTLATGAPFAAACRGTDTAGPKPAAAPATLEFFHEWDGVRTKLVEDMIADFKAVSPTLTVRHTLTRGNLSAEQLWTAIVGGSPPDVVMATTPTGVVWAHKGALRWQDDLLKRDRISAEQVFYKATFDLCRLDGRTFCLPCLVAGVDPFLMYSKQVFTQFGLDPAKPPRTWQEVEAASAKVTKRQGSQLTRIGLVPWNEPFWEWLYLNDGRIFSSDGKKIVFNSSEGQEALTWLKDMAERLYGGVAAVNDFYQATRTPGAVRGPRGPWYAGKEAMWVTIVSMFFRIDEEEPGFPLGAAQPPYNGRNPKATVATVASSAYMYAMPQGAKQVDAAWPWFKYLTMGDGAKKFILAQKRPAPVRKFTEDKAYRDLNPHWDAVIKNLGAAVALPQTPAWEDIRKAMDTATSSVLDGKLGVKEALDQAARGAQTALDQYKT